MEEIIEKIYILAKKKMLEQGGYDRSAFKQYVEENIYYYYEKGLLTDDDSEEFIISQLMDKWDSGEVQSELVDEEELDF